MLDLRPQEVLEGLKRQVESQHRFSPLVPGEQTAPVLSLHETQHVDLSSHSSPASLMPFPHCMAGVVGVVDPVATRPQ